MYREASTRVNSTHVVKGVVNAVQWRVAVIGQEFLFCKGMYTKNSHRRYTALALSLANLQSAQDAHTYRLPSGRAAPRNSLWSAPLPPIPTSNATPSLSRHPALSKAPTSSLSARILSHQTRPHTSCPQYVPERKSHTRLYTDHTRFCTQAAFNDRERPSLFFSELVPGAALMVGYPSRLWLSKPASGSTCAP